MSKSQLLLNSYLPLGANAKNLALVLNQAQAAGLLVALESDSQDYWYSGLVSLGDGLQGAMKSRYSWATVKCYYATFYLARAVLGVTGVGHFTVGRTPFSLRALAGQMPVKLSGNTHDSLLKFFDLNGNINHLCGQSIGVIGAIDWLIEQRVLANYKTTRFPDPSPTACMVQIDHLNVRSRFNAYVADVSALYCLDADHAIFAFPIELAKVLAQSRSAGMSMAERAHLQRLFSDSNGQFPMLRELV